MVLRYCSTSELAPGWRTKKKKKKKKKKKQGVDISVAVCLCHCVCVFVCTVTDFSAKDKASGVIFCKEVRRRPRQGIIIVIIKIFV